MFRTLSIFSASQRLFPVHISHTPSNCPFYPLNSPTVDLQLHSSRWPQHNWLAHQAEATMRISSTTSSKELALTGYNKEVVVTS